MLSLIVFNLCAISDFLFGNSTASSLIAGTLNLLFSIEFSMYSATERCMFTNLFILGKADCTVLSTCFSVNKLDKSCSGVLS